MSVENQRGESCISWGTKPESKLMFRTHVGRGLPSPGPTRLILVLVAAAAVGAVTVWATGGPAQTLWAPVHVYVTWVLLREIDPDHDWTAILAGLAAGVWALFGLEIAGALAIGAMAIAARLVLNSTGRRPLTTDLVVIALGATIVSYTTIGWVAGFGLAVSIYVDDRMATKQTSPAVAAAAMGALGTSLIATASGAFPQQLPEYRPLLLVALGVVSLIAVIREPEPPTSQVDSKRKNFMETRRLHGARSLIGVLLFVAAFLAGAEAVAMVPAAIGMILALISNELERVRRR